MNEPLSQAVDQARDFALWWPVLGALAATAVVALLLILLVRRLTRHRIRGRLSVDGGKTWTPGALERGVVTLDEPLPEAPPNGAACVFKRDGEP